MIKQLYNLKVEAIAVPLNYLITEYKMRDGELWILNGNYPHKVSLPPGQWEILGRANKLNPGRSSQLLPYQFMDERVQWQSYCSENGLTNELILINAAPY